jgi:NNP family nitrate/nitrite transporter-like MFS transporter
MIRFQSYRFSITPLLSEVQESLDLTKQQIWSSSIAAVTGTIVMRFILGPYCDKYGPRIPMGIILLCSAIPTGLTGLVNTAAGLATLRFFIGIGGSTFVMAQYWMSTMFTKEWVGTANAIVGGWGNLGGGITQILMGSVLFPLFRNMYDDSEKAWRTICVFPAFLGIVTAYCVIMYTDDSPKGNFSKLKKQNEMEPVDMLKSFRDGASNSNTWLLFVQYACCFGVEITMNNAAALYFKEEFGLNTEQAAAIASIFGWMNLFARGCGGFLSDRANMRWGMRGRLMWQSLVLFLEGCFVVIFAFSTNLVSAIVVLVFFSIFVQAAEGSSYGYV